jgi:hypothetical protein
MRAEPYLKTPRPIPSRINWHWNFAKLEEVRYWAELDPSSRGETHLSCGKILSNVKITQAGGSTQAAGGNSLESAKRALCVFSEIGTARGTENGMRFRLPVRPPVLCAGLFRSELRFSRVKDRVKRPHRPFTRRIGSLLFAGKRTAPDMVEQTCL